jgi:hypothetical protein
MRSLSEKSVMQSDAGDGGGGAAQALDTMIQATPPAKVDTMLNDPGNYAAVSLLLVFVIAVVKTWLKKKRQARSSKPSSTL